MAFTFLSALGHATGDSLLDPEQLAACTELLRTTSPPHASRRHTGARPRLQAEHRARRAAPLGRQPPARRLALRSRSSAPRSRAGWRGFDIGPATAVLFAEIIASAGTLLWNGPMGVFEDERFAEGTRAVAEAVARCPGTTVVGGGDSVAALGKLGLSERIDHLSTGGGASLELLEFGDLPGLAALRGRRRTRRRRPRSLMTTAQQQPGARSSAATGRCTTRTTRRSSSSRSLPRWSEPIRCPKARRSRCTRRSPPCDRCRRRSSPTPFRSRSALRTVTSRTRALTPAR